MEPAAEEPRGLRRYEEATGRPLTVLSLLVIPVYVAQALTTGNEGVAPTALGVARGAIHVALAADLLARMSMASRRLQYLATHKLDVLAVAVPPIRAGREVLSLRSILHRPGVVPFGVFGTGLLLGCALVVYAAEHEQPGASIQTVGDALWWATVTTTTVGYGDEVPVTGQGRAMAVVLMLLGVAVLAVITAHIAAQFVHGDDTPYADDLLARLARIEDRLARIQEHLPVTDQQDQEMP